MKKITLLFFLLLSLLLSACAPKSSPLAFFEKEFCLLARFSFPSLTAEGECRLSPSGNGSICFSSPDSLRGITLYKEGDRVGFTLQGISVTARDTRFFDFFALKGATVTARRQDRENVFLEAETAVGRFRVTLLANGAPTEIVTEDGRLTVLEILS